MIDSDVIVTLPDMDNNLACYGSFLFFDYMCYKYINNDNILLLLLKPPSNNNDNNKFINYLIPNYQSLLGSIYRLYSSWKELLIAPPSSNSHIYYFDNIGTNEESNDCSNQLNPCLNLKTNFDITIINSIIIICSLNINYNYVL